MVQHQHEHGRIQSSRIDRQGLERPVSQLNAIDAVETVSRSRKHFFRTVNPDHRFDVRRQLRDENACATAKIANNPIARQQSKQRPDGGLLTEQLSAKPIPVARGSGKEALRRLASLCQNPTEPPAVLVCARPAIELRPSQLPQLEGRVILTRQVEPVIPARAVSP
jgi:hypothetical protein